MKARAIVLSAVAALLWALPATAHEKIILDPDDSPGPLDTVAVELTHARRQVVLKLVTFEEWDDSALSGQLDYVRFDLDRPGTPQLERCLVVQLYPSEGEGPTAVRGTVYRDCARVFPYEDEVGTISGAGRPDRHTIEVTVDRGLLWPHASTTLRFRAMTSYEEEGDETCPVPDQPPPEHFFGTCSDVTDWARHESGGG